MAGYSLNMILGLASGIVTDRKETLKASYLDGTDVIAAFASWTLMASR